MAGYTATEFNNRLEAQTSGQVSDEFDAIREAAKTFAAALITQCDTKANGNDRF